MMNNERKAFEAHVLYESPQADLERGVDGEYVVSRIESQWKGWSARAAIPEIFDEVFAEVKRATAKFPTWPCDPLHALAVLGEEFGELTKEVLQQTYEPNKTSTAEIRNEAIQTAAMALRFVMSLDQYSYEPCKQHSQQEQ